MTSDMSRMLVFKRYACANVPIGQPCNLPPPPPNRPTVGERNKWSMIRKIAGEGEIPQLQPNFYVRPNLTAGVLKENTLIWHLSGSAPPPVSATQVAMAGIAEAKATSEGQAAVAGNAGGVALGVPSHVKQTGTRKRVKHVVEEQTVVNDMGSSGIVAFLAILIIAASIGSVAAYYMMNLNIKKDPTKIRSQVRQKLVALRTTVNDAYSEEHATDPKAEAN